MCGMQWHGILTVLQSVAVHISQCDTAYMKKHGFNEAYCNCNCFTVISVIWSSPCAVLFCVHFRLVLCECVCAYVCTCVCARVRAYVRTCVCVCVRGSLSVLPSFTPLITEHKISTSPMSRGHIQCRLPSVQEGHYIVTTVHATWK